MYSYDGKAEFSVSHDPSEILKSININVSYYLLNIFFGNVFFFFFFFKEPKVFRKNLFEIEIFCYIIFFSLLLYAIYVN